MKRFLFFVLLMVLLFVPSIHAAEWDNFYTYDAQTKTATIRNGLTLGTPIAEITLMTPHDYQVAPGYNYIAEINVVGDIDYKDFIRSVSMHDKTHEMKHINRDYDVKFFDGYENVTKDVWGCVDEIDFLNGTTTCGGYGVVGTQEYEQEKWSLLNPADLKKNKELRIRLYTEVQPFEKGEWYIDFMGSGKNTGFGTKGIKEWAGWTSGLNVSLQSYYQLDNNNFSDYLNNYSLTDGGTTNITGKIISARDFNGGGDTITRVSTGLTGTQARSFNFWVYNDNTGNYKDFITYGTESTNQWFHFRKQNNEYLWFQSQGVTVTSNATISSGAWTMVTYTFDGTNKVQIYQNGVLTAQSTSFGSLNTGTTYGIYFGSYRDVAEWWDGRMDEIGVWTRALTQEEITTLYNGGDGISINSIASPDTITLNTPLDGTSYSTQTVNFNGSTDYTSVGIANVSIWTNTTGTWAINQTNSSGVNVTDYLFTLNNIPSGLGYIWNYEVCDVTGVCSFATSNLTFSVDFAPTIIVSPSNNSAGYNLTQNFIGNFTDDIGLYRSELIISGVTQDYSGSRMWMVNFGSRSVTAFNMDGSVNNTYTGTGVAPGNIAYDGNGALWIANTLSASVTKVNKSTGALTNYSGTGVEPIGIAYDENGYMWTANSVSDTVTKIDITDGTMTNYSTNGNYPIHVAYDNNGSMWVVNQFSHQVVRMNITNGNVTGEFTGTGVYPAEISFDGTYMWVENYGSTSVSRIAMNGTITNFTGILQYSDAMAYDTMGSMWVAESNSQSVARVNVTDGSITRYWSTDDHPFGVAYDNNGSMWVVNLRPQTYQVTKVNVTDGSMTNITGDGQLNASSIAYDGATLTELRTGVTSYVDYVSGTTNSSTFEVTFSEYGTYSWYMEICDINNNCNQSGNYTLNLLEAFPPTIDIGTGNPQGVYNSSPQSFNFNFSNVVSDFPVQRVDLVINGVVNQTNSSGVNNTNYVFSQTFSDGYYEYYGVAYNDANLSNSTATQNFTIDSINPTVTITSPADPYTVNSVNESVQINWTINDSTIDACWYAYINQNTTLVREIDNLNYTTSGNTPFSGWIYVNDKDNQNVSFVGFQGFGENPTFRIYKNSYETYGDYQEYVATTTYFSYSVPLELNDNGWHYFELRAKTNGLNSNSIDLFNLTNYDESYAHNNVFVSCTLNTTTINYPSYNPDNVTFILFANDTAGNTNNDSVTLVKSTTKPNITIDSPILLYDTLKNGQSIDLNVSYDNNTILDTCWYQYSGVNTTMSCTENTTFSYGYNNNTVTVYANDTLGNQNQTSKTFGAKIYYRGFVYNNETTEGSLEDYYANVTLGTGYSYDNATLFYDGVAYTANSLITSGQNNYIGYVNLEVPNVDNATNLSFLWNIGLTDGSSINTSLFNQTVSPLNIDNCSTYNFSILNISLYSERDKLPLNGTIEVYLNLLNVPSYNSIANISGIFENVYNTQVCSQTNLSASSVAYSAEIRYYADEYATELYNIQRRTVQPSADNISLYDLNSSYSTEFKVTYQDSTFNFVEGAVIQLQRKYIAEGLYKVVEAPITSSEGFAVLHIDLNTVPYKATVVKDGVLLDSFSNLVFKCQSELTGECEYKLLGAIDADNLESYNNETDFSYTDPVLSNGTITVSYSIPSGIPSSVNIVLEQKDMFGNTTLCNKTVITSGGSIDCNYSAALGDSYVDFYIIKDGVPIAYQSYIVEADSNIDWLDNNFIFIVVLLFSLVGMALTSPEWIIVNGIITMVIAGGLFLANGLNFVTGLGSLAWLVIAGIILIFKMSKQEDR